VGIGMNTRGRSRRIGNDRAGKPIWPQGPSHHALEEASIGLDRMKSRLCCYFKLLLTRAADRQAGLFVSVLRRWVLHRAVGLCISTVWRHRRGVGLLPRQVSFDDLWILQWRQVHNKSADVSSVIDAWHTTTSTRLASPCKSLCVSYFRFELMHQVEEHRCSFFFWTAGLYLEWRACTGTSVKILKASSGELVFMIFNASFCTKRVKPW
jgi:hypothetical protein